METLCDSSEPSRGSLGDGQVREALRRILDSGDFIASDRNRRFLSYVVDETLAGRAERLKGYTIAVEVFGRDPTFDAQVDPLVRVAAGRLRRSLEQYYLKTGRSDPVQISVPKGGYVPIFERVVSAPSQTASPQISPQAAAGAYRGNAPRRRLRVFAASLGTAIVLATIALAVGRSGEQGTPVARLIESAGIGPTVLVQPFSYVDGGPLEDHISVGLTEEVTVALARFKTITVIMTRTAEPSAGTISGTPVDRGSYVLKGSIRKSDQLVRVSVQLTEGASGALLWARLFEGPLDATRPSDVQSDIAAKVATTLGDPYDVLFSNEARRVRATRSEGFEAYSCVLGFYPYWESPKAIDHGALRDCLERSVEAVPLSAEVWTNLAWLYLDEHRFDFNPAGSVRPALDRAAEAAGRAISLRPDSARAHLAMAVIQWFRRDFRSFDQHAELALSLNENDTIVAAELGLRFALRGEWERGRPLLDRAIARDPLRWQAYRIAYALHAIEAGDYVSALEEVKRTRIARHPVIQVARAAIYGHLDRADEARDEWRSATREMPGVADEPRSWVASRGLPAPLVSRVMEGLDKAGVLRGD